MDTLQKDLKNALLDLWGYYYSEHGYTLISFQKVIGVDSFEAVIQDSGTEVEYKWTFWRQWEHWFLAYNDELWLIYPYGWIYVNSLNAETSKEVLNGSI